MSLFRLDEQTELTQRCYRDILQALSRPGSIVRTRPAPGSAFSHLDIPAHLAAVCHTLLDEQVTASHCGPKAEAWLEEVVRSTGVRKVPLEEADYVLCDSVPELERMRSIKKGTLLTPEDGAMLFVLLNDDPTGTGGTLRFSGPGVESFTDLPSGEGLVRLMQRRASVGFEYPMGFDILVLGADGDMLGAPRTSEVVAL